MKCILLAPAEGIGRPWQYGVENLGEQWLCVLACSAGQALAAMEAAELVLLLPCRESGALLQAIRTAPLLAPPYILGEGAPDGPLPPLEALPELVRRRCEGRLPALSRRYEADTARLASALLRTMAVPPRLAAWVFLPQMCALTVVHPPLLNDLQHGLYPLIGRRYGLSGAAVERRLRLLVESTWTHGSLEALERFFGSSVDPEKGKPTNREFLCRMQERLTLAMKRLI